MKLFHEEYDIFLSTKGRKTINLIILNYFIQDSERSLHQSGESKTLGEELEGQINVGIDDC